MESGPALILRTLDRHLTAPGHIRLFGGAALVLGYGRRRQTEDADLLLDDEECQALIDSAGFAEAVEATNAELNDRGLYLSHIFGPEQEILAAGWRERCRAIAIDGLARLTVSVLGPEDLILTKLGRGDEVDFEDIRFLIETQQVKPADVADVLERATVPEELIEQFRAAKPKLADLLKRPPSE